MRKLVGTKFWISFLRYTIVQVDFLCVQLEKYGISNDLWQLKGNEDLCGTNLTYLKKISILNLLSGQNSHAYRMNFSSHACS